MLSRRRLLLGLATTAIAPRALHAQPRTSLPRIGLLIHGHQPTQEDNATSVIRSSLRDLGWVHGQTVTLDAAYSGGDPARLPDLAAELVRRRVDVIWCVGPSPAVAAARATKTIPVVFWGVNYPVELGLTASLPRPGGNVTGVAFVAGPGILGKQFEMLKAIAPKTVRVARVLGGSALHDVRGEILRFPLAAADDALRTLGMQEERFWLESGQGLEDVLAGVRTWRPDALTVFGDPATGTHRNRLIAFADQHRLPSVFGMKEFVHAGGLLSYGPDTAATMRRSLAYVDLILRGAKPAELPVEQPRDFEILINARTARALGLSIPASLRAMGAQVIHE